MTPDWTMLGKLDPTALALARNLAHHAVQWATKAARANLPAAPDDSHSSLGWDGAHAALLSRPLPARAGAVHAGVRLADLTLMLLHGGTASDTLALDGRTDREAGAWIDAKLREAGLAPASPIALPYALPDHPVAQGAAYGARGEAPALAELARWFAAASDVLEALAQRLRDVRPGPSPVRCWPHHFDIATLVSLEAGDAEHARSIGVGLSPGDDFYPQPYVYVNPWPRLEAGGLPKPPAPGHWHTDGFVGAVATGEQILSLADRRGGLLAFMAGAFEIVRARLGA